MGDHITIYKYIKVTHYLHNVTCPMLPIRKQTGGLFPVLLPEGRGEQHSLTLPQAGSHWRLPHHCSPCLTCQPRHYCAKAAEYQVTGHQHITPVFMKTQPKGNEGYFGHVGQLAFMGSPGPVLQTGTTVSLRRTSHEAASEDVGSDPSSAT